jgi:DNA-binding IscR family transcriptional regulator
MALGRTPDHARRQQAAELRARGLTLAEIGRQLGVTRQDVFALLRHAPGPVPRGVPCTACHQLIPTPAARPEDRPGALCLRCLRRTPEATTGQRLRAYRLAAGLSRADVAWLAALDPTAVHPAEREKTQASPATLARLARVLGVPEAPSVCILQLSAAVVRALRGMQAVVGAGPQGMRGRSLAAHCGVDQTTAIPPLRDGRLIAAGKGPEYGYRLTRPATEITLLDILEAVGWRVRLELPRVPVKGGDELHRRLQAACDDAAEAGRAVLRAVSLADLLAGGDADAGRFFVDGGAGRGDDADDRPTGAVLR